MAMIPGPLMSRFFAEDASEYVTRLLLDLLRRKTSGVEYLTFNIFNVRLDFETRMATIEDELDATSEE
jgi:hypothetical protein